jgi:predicted DNA-binding antitoxin AbrB/MazE fold protein
MDSIQAVYEGGHLRLLEPVNLTQGQRVKVTIIPEDELVRTALGDLVASISPDEGDEQIESLIEEIERGFTGVRSLSEIIIEERGEQL